MGTYKKGILGSFSGKVGTVIGSSWNGIDYMRSLPRPSSKQATEPQLIQRAKMGLATGFLRPISALVNVGYKSLAIKQTGFNVATAQVIADGITGLYPELTIDYPNVLISKGTLTGPWNPVVSSAGGSINVATAQVIADGITGLYPELTIDYPNVLISKGTLTGPWNPVVSSAGGSINVAWQDNTGSGTAKATDKLVMLVYNETQSQYVYTMEGGSRSVLADSLEMPADFVGDQVQVWVAFYAADKKTISTSLFAGAVIVA